MADVAEYTEFWVACAAAGPVLLIPAYLMVRQQQAEGSNVRSGFGTYSVAFLAAGTILALVTLAGGTPVHGKPAGRIVEMVLLFAPIGGLALELILRPRRRTHGPPGDPPTFDEAGAPEIL